MNANGTRTVFVLTDTPKLYGENLNKDGKLPMFINNIGSLLAQLKNIDMAGLVLEVDKVMKATREERDRLFRYASTFPVMRSRANTKNGFVTYLDPRDAFFANLSTALGQRERNHARKTVAMRCLFAREKDPSMAAAEEGTILDISPGGCYVQAPASLANEHFLHLRIQDMINSRPICSSVRWTRAEENSTATAGMGLMFIDPEGDQIKEIEALPAT